MDKSRITCVMLFTVMVYLFGQNLSAQAQDWLSENRANELHDLSHQFVEYVLHGDEKSALDMLGEEARKAVYGKLIKIWEQKTASGGAFVKTDIYLGFKVQGYDMLDMDLVFENGTQILRLSFDSNNRIAGIFLGCVDTNLTK